MEETLSSYLKKLIAKKEGIDTGKFTHKYIVKSRNKIPLSIPIFDKWGTYLFFWRPKQ
jgi:hypothetical protein